MIKIICIGKIKENYLKEAILEYQKRIQKYDKLQIIELPDSKIDIAPVALEEEKESILKHLSSKEYRITLEIEGKELSSLEFSSKLENLYQTNSTITFIIGGSHGIHKEIKEISNFSLSFSKMTFPHQLFRVLLLEQIYRANKIMKNESYHK